MGIYLEVATNNHLPKLEFKNRRDFFLHSEAFAFMICQSIGAKSLSSICVDDDINLLSSPNIFRSE